MATATSEQEVKTIGALKNQGLSYRDVAKDVGRSISTVRRALGRMDSKSTAMSEAARNKISAAQRARWARVHLAEARGKVKGNLSKVRVNGPIPTSEIKPRAGKYACPECGRKFPARRFLGNHRLTRHGVKGTHPTSQSMRMEGKGKEKPTIYLLDGEYHCPQCNKGYTSPNGLEYHLRSKHDDLTKYSFHVHQPEYEALTLSGKELTHVNGSHASQPSSSHRKTNKVEWTSEAIAGFLFAHVQSLLEKTCTGREDALPDITLRLSEFLHLEVSRTSQRERNLGMLHRLPGVRGEAGS